MSEATRASRAPIRRPAAIPAAAGILLLLACGGGPGTGEASSGETGAADAMAGGAPAAESHEHEGGADHEHGEGDDHTHDGSDGHTHGTGTHTHAAADTLASGVELAVESAAWTASATLLDVGDSVRVLVSVGGADAGARHAAELVAGSCDDPGAELASLTPVAAGSSGAGSSQTDVPAARLEGHAHGALRVTAGDGSSAACAPVHLASAGHAHGEE